MLKPLALGVLFWLALAALAAALLPSLPSSGMAWVAVLVLGPPVYVLLEGLGSWLFTPALDKLGSGNRLSFKRIGLAAVIGVTAAGIAAGMYALWSGR